MSLETIREKGAGRSTSQSEYVDPFMSLEVIIEGGRSEGLRILSMLSRSCYWK